MEHIETQEMFLESLRNQTTVIRGGSTTGVPIRERNENYETLEIEDDNKEKKTMLSLQAAIAQMKQKLNLPYKTIKNEVTIHDRDLDSLLERLEDTLTR